MANQYTCRDNILVLDLYFKSERQHLSDDNEKVKELSILTGHSAKSICMRMLNYQWIDDDRSGGLSQPGRKTIQIWNKFAHDERRLREIADNFRREYEQQR